MGATRAHMHLNVGGEEEAAAVVGEARDGVKRGQAVHVDDAVRQAEQDANAVHGQQLGDGQALPVAEEITFWGFQGGLQLLAVLQVAALVHHQLPFGGAQEDAVVCTPHTRTRTRTDEERARTVFPIPPLWGRNTPK